MKSKMAKQAVRKIVRSTIVGVLAATMCFGMTAFAGENTGLPEEEPKADMSDGEGEFHVRLEKELTAAKGITIPDLKFNFTFTQNHDNDVAPVPDVAVAEQTISFDNSSRATAKDAKQEVMTGRSDDVLVANQFTSAGVYTYDVSETLNTNGENDAKDAGFGVQYDSSKYSMIVQVRNKESGDGVYIANVFFVDSQGKKQEPTIEEENIYYFKLFRNKYTKQAGDDKTASLDINKVVKGKYADMKHPFQFTVTLKKAVTTPDDAVINATLNGKPVDIKYDTPWKGGLSDKSKLEFTGLPAGTVVTVTEESTKNYTASYTVGTAGAAVEGKNPSEIQSDSTGEILVDENGAVITCTNTYNDGGVVTGINFNNVPFIILIGVGVIALIGYFVYRRRTNRR